MLDLSILIVNWNTCQMLADCLRAVETYAGSLDYEIIVVDNGSTDGSVAMLEASYPAVKIIANEVNLGFARANNQAIAVAQGRYLLLLNTDAFVHAGALETLIHFMDTTPEAGIAGCRLFNEDSTLQRSCTSFPTPATELWQALWLDRLFPRNQVFGKYFMTYWGLDDCREVDCVLGACMIIRRKTLGEVGNLDERFFMYSEEVDLCYRLKQTGWKVYFVPTATATHVWGGSTKQIKGDTLLRLYRSRVLFFRKHYGQTTALAYKALLFAAALSRVVLAGLTIMVSGRREYSATARHYWRLAESVSSF